MDLSKFNNCSYSRGSTPLKEFLWWICRTLFFAHSFPVPSGVKVSLLRFFGAEVGDGVVIRSGVNITFPWKLKLGDNVWIGDEVFILSLDEVNIGSHVCLSQRAFLCTGSHDAMKPSFDLVTKPITIGDGVWVCAGSFIAPGITMEKGSMCASGSVVTKEVAASTIVGGNPAKFIKKRNED